MHILHVTRETAGDRRFGIGRSLLPVTDALRARGHEVRYLTQQDLSPRAQAFVPRLADWLAQGTGLFYGDAARKSALAWAERLNIGRLAAKLVRQQGWDTVHLHDPWMAWGYRAATLLHPSRAGSRWGFSQHGFGCYAVATMEEGLPYSPALLRHMQALERQMVAKADWVVCPTESARHQLARDLCWLQPPPNWHAVPHAKPALDLPTRAAARQQLGWPTEQKVVLAVGRINPVKRMQAIVQACVSLTQSLPAASLPLRLVLLAAGGDESALRECAAQCKQLSLHVTLAEDVAPYLAAADLYVSAARNESFGLANLEAMVAGLPMVCTAVGGVPEVTGGTAWLVPGGDEELPARLGAAMQTLLNDDATRKTLANAAGQRGAHWPAPADIAQRYEQIYLAAPMPAAESRQ